MSDLLALLFGAVIIVFFAYERFNSPGYEGSQQFERLLTYLTPDRLRARRVILRAYMFYAGTLVAIYVFLCTYAEVLPLLGAAGLPADTIGAADVGAQDAPDAAGTQQGRGLGIAPSVSLTIALVMVGLAPSFPILQRFEHWIRTTAHRLAGIPTRVVEVAENLRYNRLALGVADAEDVPADTLLIRRGDWRRIAQYYRAAHDGLAEPEDFRNDLEIVFAVSAWILDRKLKLAGNQNRARLQPLEAALRKRTEALITVLDEKSGYALPSSEPDPDAAALLLATDASAAAGGHNRAGWERLARETDELADDLSILLALYLEHEIITPGTHAPLAPAANESGGATSKPHQYGLAWAKLEGFLGIGGDKPVNVVPQSHVVTTWIWTLGVVIVVSLVWSQGPGRFEAAMQGDVHANGYSRSLQYMLMGFSTYCIPMIVALAFRDGGIQARRWNNLWSDDWTNTLPESVVVIMGSWIVATLLLVASNTWFARFSSGGLNDPWAYMGFQFEYVAPTTLRGGVLALFVLMLLDAKLARSRSLRLWSSWLSSLLWAGSAAAVMALCGGATRYMSAWAAAREFGRAELDGIDRGLVVYAALSSAVIGFFVVLCVTQALLNSRGGAGRDPGSRRDKPVLSRLPAE